MHPQFTSQCTVPFRKERYIADNTDCMNGQTDRINNVSSEGPADWSSSELLVDALICEEFCF